MPNMKFEDVIERFEKLGQKREIKVNIISINWARFLTLSFEKFHLRGLYENKIEEPARETTTNDDNEILNDEMRGNNVENGNFKL